MVYFFFREYEVGEKVQIDWILRLLILAERVLKITYVNRLISFTVRILTAKDLQ